MAIKLEEKDAGKVLEVHVTGKLVEMHDFHGWTVGAMWEDAKFGTHHYWNIKKLAMVGETKWQHGMSVFCKPFTTAQVRYFDREQMDQAQQWLESA